MDNQLSDQFNLSQSKVTAQEDAHFLCITGQEGIGDTHLTKLTYSQFVALTSVENVENELERLQRVVKKSRSNGVHGYTTNRDNTMFPEVIIVLGSECSVKHIPMPVEVNVSNTSTMSVLTIPKDADRHICDGQGRRVGIEQAIVEQIKLGALHMDTKFVICKTELISDSATFVRQIFADLHLGVIKPSRSQSIYYDNEDIINVFVNELTQVTTRRGIEFEKAVSIEGTLQLGQFLNRNNVRDFVLAFIGGTASKVRKVLEKQATYDHFLLEISRYIACLYEHLPYDQLLDMPQSEWRDTVTNNLACCAIGWKALAMVGNSLHVDAMINEQETGDSEFDASPLQKLANLPFSQRDNKLWISNQIYQKTEGKITIIKGSEGRLARLLCQHLRIVASDICNR